ncbi:hypothetical protein BGZ94_009560 [Podila epigama]|nr:hypothetical protein BGZ94_009560 [Podila epigama]
MENYHRRPKTDKGRFENDGHDTSTSTTSKNISKDGQNPQNRPLRPGVLVISPNGKVRTYVTRGLQVLTGSGTTLQNGTKNGGDTKGKGTGDAKATSSTSTAPQQTESTGTGASIPGSEAGGVLTVKAQGRSITKAVTVVEILKRRMGGTLHQFTEIGQITEKEIWDPNPDHPNLDSITLSRHRPTIRIRLSTSLPPPRPDSTSSGVHSDFGLDADNMDENNDSDADSTEPWPSAILERDAAARRLVGYQAPTGYDIYL